MSDDLISRSALKKEFDDKCAYECAICKYAKDFAPCKLIDNTPTVERPTGHWIENTNIFGEGTYECSYCGNPWTLTEGTPTDNDMNFCPKCGAHMIKEAENE